LCYTSFIFAKFLINFVIMSSHQKNRSNKAKLPMAIDCEMVGVVDPSSGQNPSELSALGRVSIVDYYGNTVYDTYCVPALPIVDYRTKWSGIRPEHLKQAPDFSTVRQQVIDIVKGRILVGHAIKNDFRALNYHHPWHLVRDTERSPWVKGAANIKTKHVSLKLLTSRLLGQEIQMDEHNSIVDALCAMGIYKVVELSWENELETKKQKNMNKKKLNQQPKMANRARADPVIEEEALCSCSSEPIGIAVPQNNAPKSKDSIWELCIIL
ncbi:hypothetical protein Ciccas_004543, partial [Cichlidogyrus casuarinus]